MCILLKLDYAKFGISSLFLSNVIEEKPFGGRLEPLPLVKEGLRLRQWRRCYGSLNVHTFLTHRYIWNLQIKMMYNLFTFKSLIFFRPFKNNLNLTKIAKSKYASYVQNESYSM